MILFVEYFSQLFKQSNVIIFKTILSSIKKLSKNYKITNLLLLIIYII